MKNNTLRAAAVALGLAFAMPAFADLTPEDVARFVTTYDFNKDGMLTRTEVMKKAAEMYDKMDKAKKGMADDKKTVAFLFELQRTDGSPGVMMTRADMMKKIEAMFDKLDTGKKGMLDRKQAEAFLKELMKSGA